MDKCKYWKYYGMDEVGTYQSCSLEDSPEIMVTCFGRENKCRNKGALNHSRYLDFKIGSEEAFLRGDKVELNNEQKDTSIS